MLLRGEPVATERSDSIWFRSISFLLISTILAPGALVASAPSPAPVPQAPPETSDEQADTTKEPTRVLFIGNSFTFWGGGLQKQLEALSKSMDPPLGFRAKSVVRGGASLEVMWKRTKAREEIASGKYDVVILQEDIPETTVESFGEYSRKFVETIRAAGARPILFMAWDYQRLDWISMKEIAAAHRQVAKALEVEVAPVGLAWKQSQKLRPKLDMYSGDREHPSAAGMTLSLLVIEATISKTDPQTRKPATFPAIGKKRLKETDLDFLRQVAARTIVEWKRGSP